MPRIPLSCPRSLSVAILSGALLVSGGCTHPLIARVNAFRSAVKSGDTEAAAGFLTADPRVWFDKKEGPGRPLTVEGGPWRHWDRFFNSTSTADGFEVRGDTVTYVITETNDYYKLIEREPSKVRITYYMTHDRKIAGRLVSGVPGVKRSPDRLKQFETWQALHHPDATAELAFGTNNPPTVECARRWKDLLVEWRAAEGLTPVE